MTTDRSRTEYFAREHEDSRTLGDDHTTRESEGTLVRKIEPGLESETSASGFAQTWRLYLSLEL